MIAILLAATAGLGMYLLLSTTLFPNSTSRLSPGIGRESRRPRQRIVRWLRQAGLDEVSPEEFVTTLTVLFLVGTVVGYSIFGTLAPATVSGVFAASFPLSGYRKRRQERLRKAREAWPRLIDDIRLQCTTMGRSLPTALFRVGTRSPTPLRPAFEAARQEWLLTTDFERTLRVLKNRLADPTADMVAETLLVAYEVGGSQIETRLASLAEDRRRDLTNRQDAHSQQSGARFARVFVLLIPAGMATAGLAIGNGREAYQTSAGQTVAVAALLLIMVCWFWAGQILRVPAAERVFVQ